MKKRISFGAVVGVIFVGVFFYFTVISGIMDLNMDTFLANKSSLVSPGFWFAPAVIITRPTSFKSE